MLTTHPIRNIRHSLKQLSMAPVVSAAPAHLKRGAGWEVLCAPIFADRRAGEMRTGPFDRSPQFDR